MDKKTIEELLLNTSLYNKILKMKEIYLELEAKQINFCNTFGIHCKVGCGECCEHFIPDINEDEAIYLAYGLIKENKDEEVLKVLSNYKDDSIYCPLYNFYDIMHHCTVYKWRPLICRLFNASAVSDKDGNPSFRQCKYNTDKRIISKEFLSHHKECLVLMSDFGEKVNEAGDDAKTYPIQEILPKYIDYIRYILEIEKEA